MLRRLVYLTAALSFWMLSSCASHPETSMNSHIPPLTENPSQHQPDLSRPSKPGTARQIVANTAMENIGAPYKWGGQNPETGFDCSGLIVYTYRMAGIDLPRTADKLYRFGSTVSRNALQKADLVFFTVSKKKLHVGIYMGDGVFVHAPGKGRKVTFATLENPYFQKNYIGSRRYL